MHKRILIDAFVQTNIHTVSFVAGLWQFASFALFLSLSLLTFKYWSSFVWCHHLAQARFLWES